MTRLLRRLVRIFLIANLLTLGVYAEVIQKITVQGNKRIPDSTVIAFSELATGLDIKQKDLEHSIKKLNEKRLFSHVAITIQHATVIIEVTEFPTIRTIDVKKNKLIPEDGINDILKKSNLQSGDVLDPVKLHAFKFGLQNEYQLNGYPDVTVAEKIDEVSDGVVDVSITVMKGKQYQIRKLSIGGNLAFSDHVLSKQMSLGTPSLFVRIFGGNYYSKAAFERSKAALTNFYIDQGFLKFAIGDVNVNYTADGRYVDITIEVDEGPRFMYNSLNVVGDKAVLKVHVPEIVAIQKGLKNEQPLPFARRDIFKMNQAITNALEKVNYPVKAIHPRIIPNDKTATVDVTLMVERGTPITIRTIDFSGNVLTMDSVLRRELALNEGEMFSSAALDESVRRLSNLGYLKNVKPTVTPVANNPKQVDIIFDLEDKPEASANLEVGFNSADYVVLSGSINHPNFGGTGNHVNMRLERSRVRTTVSLQGDVPFVLDNGASVGYKAYYTDKKNGKDNTNTSKYTWQQSYDSERVGFNLSTTVPVSIYQNLTLTGELNKVKYDYDPNDANLPDSIKDSIQRFGDNIWNFVTTAKWTRNTLDRALLPTSGNRQEAALRVGMPLNEGFTSYATLDTKIALFRKVSSWPITLNPTGRFGIGKGFSSFSDITGCSTSAGNDDSCNTELPFNEKFYASPTTPVRGVMTFGEKVNGKAIGGDLITTTSMNMFLKPFNDDMVIPSLFVDGGYTYNDHAFDFDKWVYSAGVQFRVMTPIAPILLIFSYPIKIDDADSEYGKDRFNYAQFSMQANLY